MSLYTIPAAMLPEARDVAKICGLGPENFTALKLVDKAGDHNSPVVAHGAWFKYHNEPMAWMRMIGDEAWVKGQDWSQSEIINNGSHAWTVVSSISIYDEFEDSPYKVLPEPPPTDEELIASAEFRFETGLSSRDFLKIFNYIDNNLDMLNGGPGNYTLAQTRRRMASFLM
jgi:hypothetical protein